MTAKKAAGKPKQTPQQKDRQQQHTPQEPKADDGFWSFVTRQWDFVATITKEAAAAPLAMLLANVGPPYPKWQMVATITVVGQMLTYVVVYLVCAIFRRRPGVVLFVATCVAWILAVVTGVHYVNTFMTYAVPAPNHWNRVVVGDELLPKITKYYKLKNEPIPPASVLLWRSNLKPEEVWTKDSIDKIRKRLLWAWIRAFCSCTLVFSFVQLGRRGPPAGKS